jgi:hypothetical protein
MARTATSKENQKPVDDMHVGLRIRSPHNDNNTRARLAGSSRLVFAWREVQHTLTASQQSQIW